MVFILLADTLRNFGVVGYVIQEKELTPSRLNSAAGLNFLMAWVMALIVLLSAPVVAGYYGHEGVAEVMYILSITFLLIPFGTTSMAMMRREMKFDRLAILNVSNVVVSSGGAVCLAYLGFSYLSMAWSNVLATIVNIFLVLYLKPNDLKVRPQLKGLKDIMRFGTLATMTSLIRESSMRVPDLVLGRAISLEAVAFFSRAQGLIEIFNRLITNAVTSVALPHFSSKVRQGEQIDGTYLTAIAHVTVLGWPFLVFLAISASELIPILYGDQWVQSIPLVQLLCLGELFLVPFCLQGQVLVAMGRVGLDTWISLLSLVIRVPTLLALAPLGLEIAVAGYAVVSLVVFVVQMLVLHRVIGCGWMAAFKVFIKSAIVASTVAIFMGLPLAIGELEGFASLASNMLMATLGWSAAIWFSGHPMRSEIQRLLRR